ncbi:DUF4058 family protein [Leptothoe sp. LEGE 181152]|uniref:DUF4058 family protein n=1 Tax=Adonisia turfae TaxID=2950184 RepID=UPI002029986C|nr:DUF4058 family protein [Adonisia turfae]MDV3347257.1 DUF4058 family protein [Leptothoe sp. LEGE 181152]
MASPFPVGNLFAFSLQQTVPPIPIPLLPGESDVLLELQPLLDQVYKKGRYHLAIDYSQPPSPKFAPEHQQWVLELIENQ